MNIPSKKGGYMQSLQQLFGCINQFTRNIGGGISPKRSHKL